MADAANLDRGWLGALRTLVKPTLMRREMHRKLVDARRPSVSDGRQCSQFIAPDGVVPSVRLLQVGDATRPTGQNPIAAARRMEFHAT
jgi:hypothetical protein